MQKVLRGSNPLHGTRGYKRLMSIYVEWSSKRNIQVSVKKTNELSKESREAVNNVRLGVRSTNLESATEVVNNLPIEDVLKMYKVIRDRLHREVGELPTSEESWLVEHGDKVTAVRMVRARLNCDLDMALQILSLA